jgi:hypothetical protein
MSYRFNLYSHDYTFDNLRNIKYIYDEKNNSSQNKIMTVYEMRSASDEPRFICLADGSRIGLAISNIITSYTKEMLPIMNFKYLFPRYIIEYVPEYQNTVYELFVGDLEDQKKQLHVIYTNKDKAMEEYNEMYKDTEHKHAYMLTHELKHCHSLSVNYTPIKGL